MRTTAAALLLTTLVSAADTCPNGLEQFASGCSADSDCADSNGHPLQCVDGICQCPEGIDCNTSSSPDQAAQFGSCVEMQCVDGHGHSSNSGQRENACAEKLECFQKEVDENVQPVAICMTCATCETQNHDGTFDCRSQCLTEEESEEEEEEFEEGGEESEKEEEISSELSDDINEDAEGSDFGDTDLDDGASDLEPEDDDRDTASHQTLSLAAIMILSIALW